jgi:hypothetical protein
MDRADSDLTDWFRAILRVKADPVDRAPAEGAAGRAAVDPAEGEASAGPVAEGQVLAELLAECLEAEEVAELAAVGAEG